MAQGQLFKSNAVSLPPLIKARFTPRSCRPGFERSFPDHAPAAAVRKVVEFLGRPPYTLTAELTADKVVMLTAPATGFRECLCFVTGVQLADAEAALKPPVIGAAA